jgi:hypothetical protein
MDLNDLLGQQIVLQGIAKNAKGWAVLITEDENVIYIKGLLEWSEKLLNTKIKIKGHLKKAKLIQDPQIDNKGAISQGSYGKQFILENMEIIEE